MEDDIRRIISQLEQDADQLKDAWPDSFGTKYALWIRNSVQDAARIGARTEELKARAEVIRTFCRDLLGENGEEAKVLVKKP